MTVIEIAVPRRSHHSWSMAGIVFVLVTLTFFVHSGETRAVTNTEEEGEKKGVCFYNGTWYQEGEDLPTRKMCFACRCHKGFTEPNRQTCAAITCPWWYYKEKYPGCTPEYSEEDCCPVNFRCDSGSQSDSQPLLAAVLPAIPSFCFRPVPVPFIPCKSRMQRYFYDMYSGTCKPFLYGGCTLGAQNSFVTIEDCLATCKGEFVTRPSFPELIRPPRRCKCDKRLYQHYEAKGCKPVYKDPNCDCPVRYNCSEAHMEETKECRHKGQVYQPGDMINQTNPCRTCECFPKPGAEEVSIISCANHQCGRLMQPLEDGCYHVYKKGQCCPVETKCDNKTSEGGELSKETGFCEYGGKRYSYGEKIYPKEYVQNICLCSQDYDGPNGTTCFKQDCVIEEHMDQLRRGCIPIYFETHACPIEYYCPQSESSGQPSNTKQKDDSCYFDGQEYPLHSILPVNHTTSCVTCTCRTPPDFTCIMKRCPDVPEEKDGTTCRPVFTPGLCCPTYKCDKPGNIPEFCLRTPSLSFGFCPDRAERYYYDVFSGKCKSFRYGSCTASSENVFFSEKECLDTCHGDAGNIEEIKMDLRRPVSILPECRCDEKYFQHYKAKQCTPVYGNENCNCPTHFECPEEVTADPNVCTHKGTVYQVGEKIATDPASCRQCTCNKFPGAETAEIICATVECFKAPVLSLEQRCYSFYTADKCCPDIECVDSNATTTTDPETSCEHDGKIYAFGDKIYPKENKCKVCYCNKDYNGPNGDTCVDIDCFLEKNMKKLQRGCVPVYSEDGCCPISYHCPNDTGVSTPSPQPHEADKCYFGGKSYSLNSILKVDDAPACIACTCSTPPDFTCVYHSCAMPPEAQLESSVCRPVFRPDSCCPDYECAPSEEKLRALAIQSSCSCDSRYFKHYQIKNCTPVYEDPDCSCPTRFECPSSQVPTHTGCNYKGKVYDFEQRINSTNPCKICKCGFGESGMTEVSCIHVECPENFGRRAPGCRHVYEKDRCCAVRTECGEEIESPAFTCEYQNRTYIPGEKIYDSIDPCKVCYCTENFNKGDERSCYSTDCLLEQKAPRFDEGCIPIYHEKTCCPIEYVCPKHLQMSNGTTAEKQDYMCILPRIQGRCLAAFNRYYYDHQKGECTSFIYGGCDGNENNFKTKEECEAACGHLRPPSIETVNQCEFSGHFYPLGSILDIKHSSNCVTCTCATPPDFTCIHRTCPSPPLDKDCKIKISPGACCPEYDCSASEKEGACSLPPETGLCYAAFRRYYFSPASGKCEQFIYGGCGGNGNNFETIEECQSVCSRNHSAEKLHDEYLLSHSATIDGCKELNCGSDEECTLQKLCTGRHCPLRPRCNKINLDCAVPMCSEGCVIISDEESGCLTCECSLLKKVQGASQPEYYFVNTTEVQNACHTVKCSAGKECTLQKVCTGRHCLLRPRCVSVETECPKPQDCGEGCILVQNENDTCPQCECTLLKKPEH